LRTKHDVRLLDYDQQQVMMFQKIRKARPTISQ